VATILTSLTRKYDHDMIFFITGLSTFANVTGKSCKSWSVLHLPQCVTQECLVGKFAKDGRAKADNFRMNTRYGRYGAAYNMIGFRCFNEELLLLPKNPTEAKLQATSTWGESTEPT
jgi:hypothetical protein